MLPWPTRHTASRKPPSRRPSFRGLLRDPELADQDHSGVIGLGESLTLGVALALNCLTTGLPAGLWKLGILPLAACNAALSLAALACGVRLGRQYGAQWLGRKADVLAGSLMILLGCHQALQG